MTLNRLHVALGAASLLFVSGCPTTAPSEMDANPPSLDARALDAQACMSATDCDDGLVCNGSESCTEGRCIAGTALRCDDGIACTTDFCSDELRGCVQRPPDVDGDGVVAATCVDTRGMPLGDDCDDADPRVYPSALEVCDVARRDEDCDPTTRGGLDADSDGFEDARCCNGASCGTDCNDAVRSAHPDATEVCNAIDDNCDGDTDEGVRITVYRDADGDGRGVASESMTACATTPEYSVFDDDCDDTSRLRSPLFPDVCDEIDNDCDGVADPEDVTTSTLWYLDADGDGFGNARISILSCTPPAGVYSLLSTDCNDSAASVNPAQAERCNGVDDNCNGVADFVIAAGDLEDDDRDGIADNRCTPLPSPADCDDRDPASGPGSAESCDGRDNDCDSRVDEMAASNVYFRDSDGDGFGSSAAGSIVGCVPVTGYVARGGDCDELRATRYPGASEACNGIDDDCDSSVDEDSLSTCAASSSGCAYAACIGGRCGLEAASAGTECRPATGVCDASERCDGVATACPPDSFANPAVVCRPATGVCDARETCTGSAVTCPADTLASATTVCRASTVSCDAAEACSGTGDLCPADTGVSITFCTPTLPVRAETLGRNVTISTVVLNGTSTTLLEVTPNQPVTARVAGDWTNGGMDCPSCITQFYARLNGVVSVCFGSTTDNLTFDETFGFTAPAMPGTYHVNLAGSWQVLCETTTSVSPGFSTSTIATIVVR